MMFSVIMNCSIGPYCGSESLRSKVIETLLNEITLVFYSDPNHGWRSNGILRALVTAKPKGNDTFHSSAMSITDKLHVRMGSILIPKRNEYKRLDGSASIEELTHYLSISLYLGWFCITYK